MPTREEIRQEVRRIFASRGIDPDVAERVVKQESGFNPAAKNINAKEESYGLGQLNVKGGLGVEARKRGIEPSDPSQYQKHLEFMADTVKRDGWRQWYGARDVGIGRWDGVNGAKQAASTGPAASTSPATTPRPDGAPGPADVPVLPNSGVDKGLLAIGEFKKGAENKQQQQAHQAAAARGQQQMAQLRARPLAVEMAPLATPAPPTGPEPDFAALMLPRLRRG